MAEQDPTLMLVGKTKLSIAQVKDAASIALGAVNRRGTSAGRLLSGGGILAAGKIRITEEKKDGLALEVGAVGGRYALCAFDLEMEDEGTGTGLAVVLQTFREHQSKTLGIPLGPKYIMGFDKYSAFLDYLTDEILERDPQAEVGLETVT